MRFLKRWVASLESDGEAHSGGMASSLPGLAQESSEEHPSSLGSKEREQMQSLGGAVV